MRTAQQRQELVILVEEAITAGARQKPACKVAGITSRTYRRWKPVGADQVQPDLRPLAARTVPFFALTSQEKEHIIEVCNRPEFASLPPAQIIPKLADQGIYIASESSFYRVLREVKLNNHRGRARKRRRVAPPRSHTAKRPNEVWSWDITYLPSKVRGQYYYLYLVEDVYSRYVVGWEAHEQESGTLAVDLVQKALWREKCYGKKPILHADNGAAMKSQTLQAKLQEWGLTSSHSRPGVSNDNAYVESLFRTLKYCPQWPSGGFESLAEAREWVHAFVKWYNHEHQHSRIRFVTPAQRHTGQELEVLKQREEVYVAAKSRHPARWSGPTRNWTPADQVVLNPIPAENFLNEAA